MRMRVIDSIGWNLWITYRRSVSYTLMKRELTNIFTVNTRDHCADKGFLHISAGRNSSGRTSLPVFVKADGWRRWNTAGQPTASCLSFGLRIACWRKLELVRLSYLITLHFIESQFCQSWPTESSVWLCSCLLTHQTWTQLSQSGLGSREPFVKSFANINRLILLCQHYSRLVDYIKSFWLLKNPTSRLADCMKS